MSNENDRARYEAAMHGMQSGVATEMEFDDAPTSGKHLRVGLNAAMSNMGGLVSLLIAKGVITNAEYVEAITAAMERERERYEAHLSARLGSKVNLR